MNVSLLKKRYNILIIPLLLLLCSNIVQATPACPIVTQTFQNSVNGDTVDASSTGWYLDRSNVRGALVFSAQSHRIKAQQLGGEGVWYSRVFSIAGYTNIQVDAKVSSEGTFTSSEYVKVYYKLDGGPETLISAQFGSFGTPTVTSGMLTGSTVQIVIRIYNFSPGNNDYYIEKYDVFKETGPCTVSGISVSANNNNGAGGVLTCTYPSTTLTASTTASGTTTYSWTGPNGYTATGSSVSVNTAGTYTVTGTNSAGTGSASVTVTANNSAPDLTATGGALGCGTSAVISANSSVSGATYSWTGPNGFTSAAQSPSVTAAGTYTVTVRNPATGCTASTSVTVTTGSAASVFWLEDFTFPNGTTSDAGTTPWTAATSATGTFTYSVQSNEFKTSFTGQNVGTWTSGPISLAGKSNTTLSVDLRSETASGSDAFEPADFVRVYLHINNRADSLIYEDLAGIGSSTTGTSSMTLTSGAFNGDSVRVIIQTSNSDPTERYFFDNVKLTGTPTGGTAVANGGVITCAHSSVTLTGSTTGSGATYSWTGPNSFTSAAQNPTVSVAGIYTLTVTAGGCTASDTALVSLNTTAPGATGSAPTALTCTTTSVALTGTSSTSGVTYAWTGPSGFTSSTQNPTVSVAGVYTLTVTNPANGCTSTDTANVLTNTTAPGGVNASANSSLTCTTTSVALTGASSTGGVTYAWTGPSGFTSSAQNPTVSVAGVYTLTVTNPANGCTATDTANVLGSSTAPAVPTVGATPTSAQLTCATNTILLSGNSTTTGVTYVWTGPNNFSVASSQTNVFNPGTYTLTVTNPSNGCTATATKVVTQNITAPQLSPISPSAATLTCANPSVTLTGSSSTTGVSYSWTGPNSFTATSTTAVVTSQGSYILTVTDPSNGCTNTTTATISQNFTPPAQVTAFNDGPITCMKPSVILTGNSSTTGMTYSWAGPNGFTSSSATATTSVAGTYTLTVTNPGNGCTAITNTVVAQNTSAPSGLLITSNTGATLLTCANSNLTLTASTTTTGVNFSWAGPNGFSSSSASISVTTPGTYLVTATDQTNGCVSNGSSNITQNTTPPTNLVMASNPVNALLTCSTSSIGFTASASTTGSASYSWTGPNGFTATGVTTTVTAPGTYTVKAIDQNNGCSSTTSAVVTQDTARPSSVITSSIPANGQLTCTNSSVMLTGSSTTSGVTYSWTGPIGFTANSASVTVTTAGNYTVTVTNPNNGCATSVTAPTVTQNTTVPGGVSASVADRLTCNTLSVKIKGSSTTTGVTYAWAGPGGYTSTSAENFVSVGGVYTLTATDPSNGCSFSRQITVQADQVHPQGVTISSDGSLSCTVGSVTLTGGSSTPNVDYTWTGPNGFFDPEQITSVSDSGTYLLTVHSSSNGCNTTASVVVTADFTGCSAVIRKATNGHAAMLNPSGESAITVSDLTYKVYPNPASSTAIVELNVPGSDHVSVEVYNGVGVREKVLFDGNVEAGTPYRWTLNAGSLSAGVHYCMIRTKNKVYVSKLLIAR